MYLAKPNKSKTDSIQEAAHFEYKNQTSQYFESRTLKIRPFDFLEHGKYFV
jgi:hypothetical protein